MEMGSFIELQFPDTGELYSQTRNIARLNTGRAAIWHAYRCTGSEAIWLPYYQCDTVREFLKRKNTKIKYYHIDSDFNPVDLSPADADSVLIVNYYGVMSHQRLSELASGYKNVIIDNSQSLYTKPIDKCYNVYSCRKFIGVPDGAYVLGHGADQYCDEYPPCCSSDTALFMLQRIEYGCEGKAYESRRINENRIDTEDVMQMSRLTRTILNGTDYMSVRQKRRENFAVADECLCKLNKVNPIKYYDATCVPMVYPLVVENDGLINELQSNKHFQGHWWSYLLDEMKPSDFEYWISRYIIPITIDQRYSKEDVRTLCTMIM